MFFIFLILKSLILTCVPKHEPPSHLPPHNISLGHPHAPAPSMLYPASDIDWRFNSYMIVYMLEFPFSQIIPPSPSPSESKSPLYTSVSLSLSCIQGRHCHLNLCKIMIYHLKKGNRFWRFYSRLIYLLKKSRYLNCLKHSNYRKKKESSKIYFIKLLLFSH